MKMKRDLIFEQTFEHGWEIAQENYRMENKISDECDVDQDKVWEKYKEHFSAIQFDSMIFVICQLIHNHYDTKRIEQLLEMENVKNRMVEYFQTQDNSKLFFVYFFEYLIKWKGGPEWVVNWLNGIGEQGYKKLKMYYKNHLEDISLQLTSIDKVVADQIRGIFREDKAYESVSNNGKRFLEIYESIMRNI